jgi:peptidoglycan/xylan/chitin deacetylase (PgdA/CDA1 family)
MWKRLDEKIKNGDIILSHNGTDHTADSLDKLLTNIEQKGFKVVTVSDLIYKDNYMIDSNGIQKQK